MIIVFINILLLLLLLLLLIVAIKGSLTDLEPVSEIVLATPNEGQFYYFTSCNIISLTGFVCNKTVNSFISC